MGPDGVELDPAQQAVVEHEGGALRVSGGFGSGTSTALRARAERLQREGRRPLLLRHRDVPRLATEILVRHGRAVRLADDHRTVARELVGPEIVDEVSAALLGLQTSFLGAEELRVHADAAGCLDAAEELISLTDRYLGLLDQRGLVDPAGAVVQASLLLRDPEVLAVERARFDELLVDDYQLATFATDRLLTQLAGHGGPLTVAGNADAAVGTEVLASAVYLQRFDRRMGAATRELDGPHRRAEAVPQLRLLDDGEAMDEIAREVAAVHGRDGQASVVVDRSTVASFVGVEVATAVVHGASDGRWPAPAPTARWFDTELFHGPDVPDGAERTRRWRELERRRFLVATSRATQRTILLAHPPVTPFVAELVR